MKPLVLRCDLAGELVALGRPPGDVVLDLEQALPDAELLDRAGHAALLLHSLYHLRTPQLSWRQSSSETARLTIPRTSVSAEVRGTAYRLKLDASEADTSAVTSLRQVEALA
jgi:hypothetical protein